MYRLKRSVLNMHPCRTPFEYGKKAVFELDNLTAHFEFVYRLLISWYKGPSILFSRSLKNRPPCQTESKAFLKSTKQV
jgi:hypothetical protein